MTAECIVGRRTEHTGRGGTIHIIGGTYLNRNQEREGFVPVVRLPCRRPANVHRLCFRQLQVLFPAKYYCIYIYLTLQGPGLSSTYPPPCIVTAQCPVIKYPALPPTNCTAPGEPLSTGRLPKDPPFPPPPPQQGKCLTSTGTWNWNQLRLSPLYYLPYLPDLTS